MNCRTVQTAIRHFFHCICYSFYLCSKWKLKYWWTGSNNCTFKFRLHLWKVNRKTYHIYLDFLLLHIFVWIVMQGILQCSIFFNDLVYYKLIEKKSHVYHTRKKYSMYHLNPLISIFVDRQFIWTPMWNIVGKCFPCDIWIPNVLFSLPRGPCSCHNLKFTIAKIWQKDQFDSTCIHTSWFYIFSFLRVYL